jgi:hypothetical protein
MTEPMKFEIVKKLEYMVAFQQDCLNSGNWDEFDRLAEEIKKLELEIMEADMEFDPI